LTVPKLTDKHKQALQMLSSPAIILVREAEDGGSVRYVSDSIKLFGYSPGDFQSGNLVYESLVHPLDRERVMRDTARLLQEKALSFDQQYRVLTAWGDIRWVEECCYKAKNQHGVLEFLQTTIFDVSQLMIEAEFYRDVVDISTNIFLVLDSDGRVKDFNTKACDVTGASPTRLMGSVWVNEFIPHDNRLDVCKQLQQVAEADEGDVIECEGEITDLNGSRRTITWAYKARRSPLDEASEIVIFW